MPIDYSVDHDLRLVHARGHGILTHQDVFGYQREVWSQPAMAGYNELIDMTAVEHIALPSVQRVQELASVSATMDAKLVPSRFAIVAPQDVAFGLGRMYQTLRDLEPQSTKEVGVFRTMGEARTFLGLEGDKSG